LTEFDILKRFHEKHFDLVRAMRESDHNYSFDDLNPYHLEGDVWTHTMMVFNYAVSKKFPKEVVFAALFHDIGKPFARNVKKKDNGKNYVSFHGHDGISFYLCLDVMRSTYADVLSEEEIETIARLVANHSVLYSWQNDKNDKDGWVREAFAGDSAFLSYLSMLVEADSQGRICERPSRVDDFRKYRDFVTHPESKIKTDQPTLTVLVGAPCSGKSTWVKEHAAGDEVIISSDDIVEEIGVGETYNEKFNSVDFKEIESIMMSRFHKAVKEKKNIIVDRTNMSKKSRRRFVATANGYHKRAVVFFTDKKEIVLREVRRHHVEKKSIPDKTYEQMMKAFSFPLKDEFDAIIPA